MSVGFLYFAHERSEYNSIVNVIQRGVNDNGELVAMPAFKHWTTRKAHVAVESFPTRAAETKENVAAHVHDLLTELQLLQEEIAEAAAATEPDVTTTTGVPSRELAGYVDVINGLVS